MEIARAGAHLRVKARDSFKVVIEHVRARLNNSFQDAVVAADEIRRQNFDGCIWAAIADGADGLGKVLCPAIFNIVTVNRGDYNVVEPQLCASMGNAARLKRIQCLRRFARCDVAEGASPRANVTHDHHGSVALAPAFAHIGTARFLADGDEVVVTHDFARRLITFTAGRTDLDPVRLFGLRVVWRVRFLWVALFRDLQIAHGFQQLFNIKLLIIISEPHLIAM